MDFSRPEALPEVASYVRRTGTPLLSGTTGYTEAEKGSLFALGSAAPVLWSANYSLGVAVLARALQVIAPVLGPDFDIEITDTHHSQKADAPSGTAKLLLEAVDPQHRLRPVYGREGNCGRREKDEVGIHALRGTKIWRLAARWVSSSSSSGPKKWTVWVPATVPPRSAWMPL